MPASAFKRGHTRFRVPFQTARVKTNCHPRASSPGSPVCVLHALIMDRDRLRLLYLLHLRKKKRHRRRLWIHPLIAERSKTGAFNTLFHELRQDNMKFFNYFRMSITTFDELLNKLHDHLLRQDSKMRDSIKPVERLSVALR